MKVTINGAGQVTQLSKGGKNLMASGNTLYVSESGGSSYYSISASSHSVVRQSADLVELSSSWIPRALRTTWTGTSITSCAAASAASTTS